MTYTATVVNPADVVRINLLKAREQLEEREKALMVELEQLRKGIDSIDTTIAMVCSPMGLASIAIAALPSSDSNGHNGSVTSEATLIATIEEVPPAPKSRGGRPKSKTVAPSSQPKNKKGRPAGRPPKKAVEAAIAPPEATTLAPKRRGRPPKNLATASVMDIKIESPTQTLADAGEAIVELNPLPKAKGTKTAKSSKTNKTTRGRKKSTSRRGSPARGRKAKSIDDGWQTFLVEDYKTKPLTEVVNEIFDTLPDAVLGSNELISRIFTSDISPDARKTARDRLLNILSIGVNENRLQRIKHGKYALIKPA